MNTSGEASEHRPSQVANLKTWLQLRRIELEFSQSDEDTVIHAVSREAYARFAKFQLEPDKTPVEIGQIRLMRGRKLDGEARELYVAVFRLWHDDLILTAPFSKFYVPALPGELELDREDAALSVICLWNAHTATREFLAQSWFVDELTETEMNEAWSVFRCVMTGSAVPEALRDRVGLPVYRKEDPRIAYQAEEIQLMKPFAVAALATEALRATSVDWFQELCQAFTKKVRAMAQESLKEWQAGLATLQKSADGILEAADDQARYHFLLWNGPAEELAAAITAGCETVSATIAIPLQPDDSGEADVTWKFDRLETELGDKRFVAISKFDGNPIAHGRIAQDGDYAFLVKTSHQVMEEIGLENLILVVLTQVESGSEQGS